MGGRLRTLLVVAALCVLGFLGWRLAYRGIQRSKFDSYAADARAAGEPTTLEELLGPAPRDDENAAPELLAASAALQADVGPEKEWKTTGPWEFSDDERPWIDRASPAE